jgi:transcription-repair coupling factor (superfamily II helicase)
MNQRLTVYRRFAAVRTEPELDRLMDEVRDRYGNPPDSVLNLAEYASIRLMADRIGIESIDREAQIVVLKFRPEAKLDPQWLFRVVQERGDVVLVPPATLKLDMRKPPAVPRRPAPAPVAETGGRLVAGGKPRAKSDPVAAGSWWTARARAGEVTSGFTRDEILRPAKEDPRAEGGVFTRVAGLLRELSAGSSLR